MIGPHARLVFLKDGREILRDRRTLFVNLLLPVLLYPLMMLFVLQASQLVQARPAEDAAVAVVDLDAALLGHLREAARPATGAATRDPVAVVEPAAEAAGALRAQAQAVLAGDRPGAAREQVRALREAALAALRRSRAVAALVALPAEERGKPRLVALLDDASPRLDDVREAIDGAEKRWRRGLVETRLRQAGLDLEALEPVAVSRFTLAPIAEAVRTRIAGMVPLLLVMMAALGAFWPAVDLVAGERERGTLETLMAWPGRRRQVFLGKLLVVCAAALASVVLNLGSFALTTALMVGQVGQLGPAAPDLGSLFSVGGGTLALCLLVLLPVVVTVSALSLVLSGLAASAKEAQNYLSPLLIAVMGAAAVALIPRAAPTVALDLVPVTGAVVALKEALQAPTPPWGHLLLATLASLALAAVVVTWSARLMDDERFRYPGLNRAGWGRFRRWGRGPAAPGGLEVMAVYAVAVGGMTLGAGLLGGVHPVARVVAPLLLFVALPALLHHWLGAYRPAEGLFLVRPRPRHLGAALLLAPAAISLSLGLGQLQQLWLPAQGGAEVERQVRQIMDAIAATGGLPLMLACLALTPAVCEELLCRGTLLSGLGRGLGRPAAVVVSAFLFAALHLSPYRLVPQCALGMVLAWLTLRTGSVVPAMLVHFLHNGLLVSVESLGGQDPWRGWGTHLQAHPLPWLAAWVLLSVAGAWGALRLSRPATADGSEHSQ